MEKLFIIYYLLLFIYLLEILLVSTIRKYKEQHGEIIYYLLFIIYLFIRNSPCKYHTKVQRTAWRNYLLFIIYYLFIY